MLLHAACCLLRQQLARLGGWAAAPRGRRLHRAASAPPPQRAADLNLQPATVLHGHAAASAPLRPRRGAKQLRGTQRARRIRSAPRRLGARLRRSLT